jgi:hypothetical protein
VIARLLWLLPAFSLASCATVRQEVFIVEAINTQETQVPCVIFIDDEIQRQKPDGPELVTPQRVTITFRERQSGSGYDSVKLSLKSVKVDQDGKVIAGLRKGDTPEYQEDSRAVHTADAPRQLFVLYRRRAGS